MDFREEVMCQDSDGTVKVLASMLDVVAHIRRQPAGKEYDKPVVNGRMSKMPLYIVSSYGEFGKGQCVGAVAVLMTVVVCRHTG